MRKKIKIAAAVICVLALLTSCRILTSSIQVEILDAGNKIEARLDTSHGLSMTADLPFSVLKNGADIVSGIVATGDSYDLILQSVKDEPADTEDEMAGTYALVEESEKDGNPYFLYTVTSQGVTEYSYAIRVADADATILLSCVDSQAALEEVFAAMTFSAAEA